MSPRDFGQLPTGETNTANYCTPEQQRRAARYVVANYFDEQDVAIDILNILGLREEEK